jgi:tetratricopeptide (TPR) repeat protein
MVTVGATRSASGQAWADEALLWTELGQWRLERREAEAALLAFKRAEAATPDDPGKERLRLAQARALVQVGQGTAAKEILVHLAFAPGSTVARPALATLGALRFQDGQVQESLTLLKKAVEEGPGAEWPGRSEAEADLGLAYLTTGDEASGLRWLHAARQHFEKSNDSVLLARCLENEAAYQEHRGNSRDADALRQRVRQVEGD